MAKLTKQQWVEVRRQWETDERDGHQWLADELIAKGYDVTRAAIAKAAKRQDWTKRGTEKTTQKSVTRNVTQSDKTSPKKVTQKPAKNVVSEAAPEPEWEEVDEAETNLGGRPSKYMPHFDRQAHLLCRLGATDAELAEFFHVTEQTINNWKNVHITFFESIKSAKLWADAEAADGLFKRATGFRYTEVKTKQVRPMSEDDGQGGIQAAGDELMVVEVVTTEKEALPDVSAAFIWLRNRRPKDWRDKIDVKADITVTPIPWDELREITKAAVVEAERKHRELLENRYAALGIKREEYDSD